MTRTYHSSGRRVGRPSKQQEIIEWLRDYINSGIHGKRLATRVEIEGVRRGFSVRTLQRAKKALGFESIRVGGSDGDWIWVNPHLLNPNSITQDLTEKLDRREKRLTGVSVTSKAQSRARIANGWLQQITEEMFNQGKTLEQIREGAAIQNPYLTDRDFLSIEEEFQRVVFGRLASLETLKSEAEKAYENTRTKLTAALLAGEKDLTQAETEMKAAEDQKNQQIESVKTKVTAIEDQIGPDMFHKLTKGT